jgi:hypothetical protein
MPAPPRAEFVDRLKHRLESKSNTETHYGEENPGQILLIALAGAISGAIILVMGIQVIRAILNQKGAQRENHTTSSDPILTIPTA